MGNRASSLRLIVCVTSLSTNNTTLLLLLLLTVEAKDALLTESAAFGFRIKKELEDRVSSLIQRCQGTTFLVHQHRHLTKMLVAEGKADEAATRTKSSEAMTQHNAKFSDLPTSLLCPVFEQGVKDKILA